MKRFVLMLPLFLFISTASVAQVNLNSGLVAYYPFNGNANDESGNGLHGIERNGVQLTSDKYGNPSSAYFFDGIDDYIEILDDPRLRFRDSFSVCISYMHLDNTSGNLIEKREYSTGANTSFDMAAGSLGANGAVRTDNRCDLPAGTADFTLFTQPPIPNRWYCIVMTFNQGILNFYEDGILISSTTTFGNKVDSCEGSNIRIGRHLSFDPIQMYGKIDEVRLYNRAINEAEINSLCNVPASVGNTINNWTPVLNYDACFNKLTVENASYFKIGDTVLLIQMKGAVADSSNTSSFGNIIDYKSAGNYEFNYVKKINGNEVELSNTLNRTYQIPDGLVQLIRVPYYENAVVSSTVTCIPWDGKKGGVLVLNAGNITLNADIDVSGKGFRGGPGININQSGYNCSSNNFYYELSGFMGAAKGEGITELSPEKSYGKGKLANGGGGGNAHNSGGGGGSNATQGGSGGYQLEPSSFSPCNGSGTDNRGLPGSPLNYDNNTNKIYLGGGGGAGHDNNLEQFGAAGGNGGGIAIINASYVSLNNRQIIASGNNGLECAAVGSSGCHEGMGGGGAGGTIVFNVTNTDGTITFNTSGGKGADMVAAAVYTRVGPGGGGSGGVCWFKGNSSLAANHITGGGASGVCTQISSSAYGAANGEAGTSLFNLQLPVDTVAFVPCTVVPVNILAFTAYAAGSKNILVKWLTEEESSIKYYVIERSTGNGLFTSLTTINAANKGTNYHYSYTDATAQPGVKYFYRLRIIQTNGDKRFTSTREAILPAVGINNVTIYPNPAKEVINVKLPVGSENATIILHDFTGSVIDKKTLIAGGTAFFNTCKLAKGIYSIRVINSNGTVVKQVAKL